MRLVAWVKPLHSSLPSTSSCELPVSRGRRQHPKTRVGPGPDDWKGRIQTKAARTSFAASCCPVVDDVGAARERDPVSPLTSRSLSPLLPSPCPYVHGSYIQLAVCMIRDLGLAYLATARSGQLLGDMSHVVAISRPWGTTLQGPSLDTHFC